MTDMEVDSTSASPDQHMPKRLREEDADAAAQPAKRQLILAPETDRMSDDRHKFLDFAVILEIEGHDPAHYRTATSLREIEPMAAVVLQTIVRGTPSWMRVHGSWHLSGQATKEEQLALLEKALAADPGLEAALLEAIGKHDFKPIRNAGKWRATTSFLHRGLTIQ